MNLLKGMAKRIPLGSDRVNLSSGILKMFFGSHTYQPHALNAIIILVNAKVQYIQCTIVVHLFNHIFCFPEFFKCLFKISSFNMPFPNVLLLPLCEIRILISSIVMSSLKRILVNTNDVVTQNVLQILHPNQPNLIF